LEYTSKNNSESLPLAVILASGGLDSCVTASIAAHDFRLAMMHVQYSQRTASREEKAFREIATVLGAVKTLIIHMDYFRLIKGSSLTDPAMAVPSGNQERTGIPSTYVPFRNAALLCAAVSWAEVIQATKIFIGVNEIDSSGYPDCRVEFLEAFKRVIRLGTRPETNIEIIAPLAGLNKTQIVSKGMAIGAPVEKSWSCYQNEDLACGICDSCQLRLKGFMGAGFTDPIPYIKSN
jgi:7-cyano-7-deazaguanine synthase